MKLLRLTQPVSKVISALILDESSSMDSYGNVPLLAANNHLDLLRKHQKETGISYWVSIVTFSDSHREAISLAPLKSDTKLQSYSPSGGTCLFGSVEKTMRTILAQQHNSKVILAVVSDGGDGDESSAQKLRKTVRKAIDAGWSLMAFGIGIDSKALAQKMGFPIMENNTKTLNPTKESVQVSIQQITQATVSISLRSKRDTF